MDNYEQYRSVYKNVGMTPRTMDEAYKTPNYAAGIFKPKSELRLAWEFVCDALIGFVMVMSLAVVILCFLIWLGIV